MFNFPKKKIQVGEFTLKFSLITEQDGFVTYLIIIKF